MQHKVAQRAFTLSFTALMLAACFSASTPKDLTELQNLSQTNDGILILDASPPADPGNTGKTTDTYVAPEDTAVEDVPSQDLNSPPDILIPDFASPPDSGQPEDTSTADTSIADTSQDTSIADTAEDTATPEDTNDTDSWTEDITTVDAPTPCEGINCPGTQAPEWALEDFQPESPWFKESYGLEKFQGKVTVMVLLAGW